LQKLGIIRYSRGQVTVLDRRQLERQCCECYAVAKKETDRLARMNAHDRKHLAAAANVEGVTEDAA
jgi:hypothetical protein